MLYSTFDFCFQTRASWNNDLFSPYSYLYEMPKNYHSCNSSLWMNRTDLRGDVFLSFRVMSIKGNTMINNANICEKYCCQEPRCQSWTVRLQQADTANCAKGLYHRRSPTLGLGVNLSQVDSRYIFRVSLELPLTVEKSKSQSMESHYN